jgi:fructan beta-fructosidase
MFITNNLLNLPVYNNGPSRHVTIMVGGIPVRDFDINLADGAPDWWAFVDVSAFQGQTATVTVDNLSAGSTGLSSIVQSNGIVGATNLYSESLRPQVHYTGKRGLINDVNGMIYDNGQYNLYYQHNPYSLNFSANGAERNWGHAVSPTWCIGRNCRRRFIPILMGIGFGPAVPSLIRPTPADSKPARMT